MVSSVSSSACYVVSNTVADLDLILAAIPRDATVIVVDAHTDFLSQMSAKLPDGVQFDALHLISHGASGELALGSEWINQDYLSTHADAWSALGTVLRPQADVLVYGCDVAAGEVGQQFTQRLANLLQVDVAASTNPTGAGDWTLEYTIGQIEAIGLDLGDRYQATLAASVDARTFAGTSSSYANIGTMAGMNVSNLTAETWLKTTDTFAGLISYAEVGLGANAFLLCQTGASSLEIWVGGRCYTKSGLPTLNNDEWRHVAVTWAGSTGDVNVFIDGTSYGAATPSTTAFVGSLAGGGTLVLGQDFDGTNGNWTMTDGFAGTLDNVRLWNLVRSPTLISNNRDIAVAGTTTGLISQWNMNQTGVLTDSNTTNKNDLNQLNTSSWQLAFTTPTAVVANENSTTATTISLSPNASNDGFSRIEYAIAGADAALFSVDRATGVIRFLNAPNYEAPNDAGADRVYNLTLSATPFDQSNLARLAITTDITISLANINEVGSISAAAVTLLEDGARSFAMGDFGWSDPDGDALDAVVIASLPSVGSLRFNGNAVSVGQVIAASQLGNLTYTAAANAHGSNLASISFQGRDAGGLVSNSATVNIHVTSVNDAPTATNRTLTLNEDSSYTFGAADFGFADSDGNSFANLIISSLPAAGSLKLNGVAVTAGQSIAVAQLGGLVFSPAANANGNNYASFGFRVQDNGGTANGGADTSGTFTMSVNVNAVNDAPTATNRTLTLNEDSSYTFGAADFGFTDSDGNSFANLIITSVPTAGSLKFNGVAVTAGQSIAVAQLGNLVFSPAANANGNNYASFGFRVQDNGGTANGGADSSGTFTMSVNVNAVNDAPTATNRTLTLNEDSSYTFGAADFGFADSDGNSFANLIISSVPTAGSLKFNGVAVTAGQSVAVAQLGNLVFSPAVNANGNNYASFGFRVQDNGGTANGGIDTSGTFTMSVNVNAVNDAPTATNRLLTLNEDSSYAFNANDFGFADVDDHTLSNLIITSVPTAGNLKFNGVAVTAGQSIAVAQLGSLVFSPAANANGNNYASFGFRVQDNGGTANGGIDSSSTFTLSVNINAVNDAPTATNRTLTLNEDSSYAFNANDFGFADVDDHTLSNLIITSVPIAGSLKFNGVAVTAGQSIAVAQLGNLVFSPAANANGNNYASFGFRVQDNGGTANGGADTSGTFTLSFNVNAVNDAPQGAVWIEGQAQQGQVLLAQHNLTDADGLTTIAWQWQYQQDNGTWADLAGATQAQYTLGQQDVGRVLRSVAHYTDAAGTLETAAAAATVAVLNINDAPTGQGFLARVRAGQDYQFQASEFGFADVDGDAFAGIVIEQLPERGQLLERTNDGEVAVVAGQFLTVAQLETLIYRPTASEGRVTGLTFRVRDSGGIADGGVDTDLMAQQILFDFAPRPTVQLSHAQVEIDEGAGTLTMVVQLDAAAVGGETVTWTLAGGYAHVGRDVDSPVMGTLSFAAGETQKIIQIKVVDDALIELNEQTTLTLSNWQGLTAGAQLSSTLTVVDNDFPIGHPLIGQATLQGVIEILGLQTAVAGLDFDLAQRTEQLVLTVHGPFELKTLLAGVPLLGAYAPDFPSLTVTGDAVLTITDPETTPQYALSVAGLQASDLAGLLRSKTQSNLVDILTNLLAGLGEVDLAIDANHLHVQVASVDLSASLDALFDVLGMAWQIPSNAAHSLAVTNLQLGFDAQGLSFAVEQLSGNFLKSLLGGLEQAPQIIQDAIAALPDLSDFAIQMNHEQIKVQYAGGLDIARLLQAATGQTGIPALTAQGLTISLSNVTDQPRYQFDIDEVDLSQAVSALGQALGLGNLSGLASLGQGSLRFTPDGAVLQSNGNVSLDLRSIVGGSDQPILLAGLQALVETLTDQAGSTVLTLGQPRVSVDQSEGEKRLQLAATLNGGLLEIDRASQGIKVDYAGTIDLAAILNAALRQVTGQTGTTGLTLTGTGIHARYVAGKLPTLKIDQLQTSGLQSLFQGLGIPDFALKFFDLTEFLSLSLEAGQLVLSIPQVVDIGQIFADFGFPIGFAFEVDSPTIKIGLNANVPAFELDIARVEPVDFLRLFGEVGLPPALLDFLDVGALGLSINTDGIRLNFHDPINISGLFGQLMTGLGLELSLPDVLTIPRIELLNLGKPNVSYRLTLPQLSLGSIVAGLGLDAIGLEIDPNVLADLVYTPDGFSLSLEGRLDFDVGKMLSLDGALPFIDQLLDHITVPTFGDTTLSLFAPQFHFHAGQFDLTANLNGREIALHLGDVQALRYRLSDIDIGGLLGISILDGLTLKAPEVAFSTGDYRATLPDLSTVQLNSGLSYLGAIDFSGFDTDIGRFIYNKLGLSSVNAALSFSPASVSLNMSVAINVELFNIDGFHASLSDLTVGFAMDSSLLPAWRVGASMRFGGYDPTQSDEPTLDLKGHIAFDPLRVRLSFSANPSTSWNNPFGIAGASIRKLSIELGGTYAAPYTSVGFVGDLTWDSKTFQAAFAVGLDQPTRQAFVLTLQDSVNLFDLYLGPVNSLLLKQLGNAAPSNLTNLMNLLKSIVDLNISSIDSNRDGTLDPLIKYVPVATQIGDTVLTAGFEINGKLTGYGTAAMLNIKSNTAFTGITGSLSINDFNFKGILSVSGQHAGTPLNIKVSASALATSAMISGTGKISLFGHALVDTSFAMGLSVAKLGKTSFSLGIMQVKADSLTINLKNLTASGTNIGIVLLGVNVASVYSFSMSQTKATLQAGLNFGSILKLTGKTGDYASITWTQNSSGGVISADGKLSVLGVEMAGVSMSFSATTLSFKNGTLGFGVIGLTGIQGGWNTGSNSSLSFAANAQVFGQSLGKVDVSVTSSVVSFSSNMDLGVVKLNNAKWMWNKNTNAVTATASVEFLGIALSAAKIAVNPHSLTITSTFNFGPLRLVGASINTKSDGTATLSAPNVSIFGMNMAQAKLTVNPNTITVNQGSFELWNVLKIDLSNTVIRLGQGSEAAVNLSVGGLNLGAAQLSWNSMGQVTGVAASSKLDLGDFGKLGFDLKFSEGRINLKADTPFGNINETFSLGGAFDLKDIATQAVLNLLGGLPAYVADLMKKGITNLANMAEKLFDIVGEVFDAIGDFFSGLFGEDRPSPVRFSGTAGADDKDGDDAADILIGQAGNDIMNARDGDDLVDGGPGNDDISGGNDHDMVNGGDGNDKVYGWGGNDQLYGADGDDAIYGNGDTGNQYANEYAGDKDRDLIEGGAGNDYVEGGLGNDRINGGRGNDRLYGSTTTLPSDETRFYASSDRDVISGGSGADFIDGGHERDFLYGDLIKYVEQQANQTDAEWARSLALSADLSDLALNGADELYGGLGDDFLYGQGGDDLLHGGEGTDMLYGGKGNDILIGASGNNQMYGGIGNDTLNVSFSGLADEFQIIDGGSGNDLLQVESVLFPAKLEINLTTGQVRIPTVNVLLNRTEQTLIATLSSIERVTASIYDDLVIGSSEGNMITGMAGDDNIQGMGGNDTLNGGDGHDTLLGGLGDDSLYGGNGNDVMKGEAGNDKLYGGHGNDDYFLSVNSGVDTIFENSGQDRLFALVSHDQLWLRRLGDDLEISIIGTSDKRIISNWYVGVAYRPEKLLSSDNQLLTNANVIKLVNSMASFAPPPMGQTTLTSAQKNGALGVAIEQYWDAL